MASDDTCVTSQLLWVRSPGLACLGSLRQGFTELPSQAGNDPLAGSRHCCQDSSPGSAGLRSFPHRSPARGHSSVQSSWPFGSLWGPSPPGSREHLSLVYDSLPSPIQVEPGPTRLRLTRSGAFRVVGHRGQSYVTEHSRRVASRHCAVDC